MTAKKFHLHDGESGSALAVRLIPLADRNHISRILDDGTIEIRLASSKPDLNQPLRSYLARLLQVKANKINIIAGKQGNEKLVSILDMKPEDVQKLILKDLE